MVNNTQMKNLKERIKNGEAVNGCWLNMASTISAEIVGRTGFDWVLIDLEHGAGNEVIMYQQLQVLQNTTAAPLVRTNEISRPKAQNILDAGAGGIMFPQIQTAEEAQAALRMMYYPPKGVRGLAKMVRATGFGKNFNEYMTGLENNLVGVIQIETLNAVKQIDAIAALKETDVLFVGPSDLSLALGIFGQFNHSDYRQVITQVAQAAQKHGKAAGILLQDVSEYEMYYELGFRFIACGADTSFVARGAENMIKQMNDYLNSAQSGK
jgi:4-hydroxy-2-oxoheptanedioate aldolase